MSLAESRLLSRLAACDRILIAGAGGGFDVYSGLPLYFHLKALGKQVFLGNLSFTALSQVVGRRLTPSLVEVTAASEGPSYFPEGVLTRWLALRGEPAPVYCFERQGCRPLSEAYRTLSAELDVDCVLLVDGGTDILMRGDEAGLGTPEEDISSVAAVSELDVREKLVACLGFGIDAFHGVCHAHFLENVAALSREGAYLGVLALLPEMFEVQRLCEAVRFANERMPRHPSIVANSVVSAVDGDYGDVHRVTRTAGSRLWINPLMSLYWGFDLRAVARRCLYLDAVLPTESAAELAAAIGAFRARTKERSWEGIPV